MARKRPKPEPVSDWENEGGAMPRDPQRLGAETPQESNAMNTNAVNAVNATIAAVCLVFGLALGAVAGAWYEGRDTSEKVATVEDAADARARTDAAELSRLNARVDLLQIHLRLGRIALEADHQDYGSAGERAKTFFDDVARMAKEPTLGESEGAALEKVLAARDELIAGLATAQPSAAERLKALYLQLFDVVSPT